MGLRAALVDRGRFVAEEAGAQKVEGTTVLEPVVSAWFRIRLEPPDDDEAKGPGEGERVVRRANFLADRRDEDGVAVEFAAHDKLEVRSPQLGDAVWEIEGRPTAIRKKRTVIAWEGRLKRLEDEELQPVMP